MSKHKSQRGKTGPGQPGPPPGQNHSLWSRILNSLVFLAILVAILLAFKHFSKLSVPVSAGAAAPAVGTQSLASASPKTNASRLANTNIPVLGKAPDLPTLEINHAVMVTVELDFGPTVPSIAEALNYIERRSQPDDGKGRTFAILDAYGEPTPDKKKLHLSMHVSAEKPGLASLVFSKSHEVLWQAKIVSTTNAPAFTGKNLTILLDAGAGNGKAWMLDGSTGPTSILDATVKDLNKPARDVWPDGAEREITFIYSACGCPVKVMVKRTGDRTLRTKDLPVIFPDDPAVVALLNQLMGW